LTTTDHVLAQIDRAIADTEVSPDAVRCAPPPTDRERLVGAARGLAGALGLLARRVLP
jgi:hypothetical protein